MNQAAKSKKALWSAGSANHRFSNTYWWHFVRPDIIHNESLRSWWLHLKNTMKIPHINLWISVTMPSMIFTDYNI